MVWKGGTICGAVLLFELDKTFELSEEDRHFLQYFTGTTPSKVVFAMEDRGKGLRKDPKQPRCWKWHALCKPIKARVYLFTPPFRQQLYRDKTNELTRLKYKVTNFAKGLSLILYLCSFKSVFEIVSTLGSSCWFLCYFSNSLCRFCCTFTGVFN